MRDQLVVMKAVGEAQFDIAKANIEAAEKSAIYAQRAYVMASIKQIEEGFKIHLRIENNGNTPANNVHVVYSCGMREEPPYRVEDNNVVVYDSGWNREIRLGLIAPNRDHVVITPSREGPTGVEWPKWKLSQARYYCWGRIIYEDIFNQKRHTDFAFFQGHGYPSGCPCEYGNEAY
jgi:hypothetical protein